MCHEGNVGRIRLDLVMSKVVPSYSCTVAVLE